MARSQLASFDPGVYQGLLASLDNKEWWNVIYLRVGQGFVGIVGKARQCTLIRLAATAMPSYVVG